MVGWQSIHWVQAMKSGAARVAETAFLHETFTQSTFNRTEDAKAHKLASGRFRLLRQAWEHAKIEAKKSRILEDSYQHHLGMILGPGPVTWRTSGVFRESSFISRDL